MCGRFVIKLDDNFYFRYEIDEVLGLESNYNVAPFSNIPVVVKNSPKKVVKMKWGFIPSWAKTYNPKYAVINTRAESIDEKPYFKSSFKKSRCLIPATGFYEWKREGDEKTPYYFHMKDSSYFSFAGIYSIWKNENNEDIYTCSIVTTTPNKEMESIHDRMPVILSKEDEEIWLDKTIEDENILKPLLKPYTDSKLDVYEVDKKVNSPKNKGEDLLVKVG